MRSWNMKHICVVARIYYQYNAHMKHICVIARIYALAYVRTETIECTLIIVKQLRIHHCQRWQNQLTHTVIIFKFLGTTCFFCL